jgi:peptidoglycan/xylan/chitin deacetylase (PgdA/CDA1 family)
MTGSTASHDAAGRAVPILMYHALSAASTAAFRRWTLAPDRFEAHLAYLSQSGYRSITVAGLLAHRHGGGPTPAGRLIALTFDDAYADFHSVALPLLIRYGMTATLFVPTGHVGRRSGWMRHEGEGERPILSWAALAEIAGCGIEIGTHSHTHPELDRVGDGEIPGEVRGPKALVEDRLGVVVHSFAYPYGHYDRRVRDSVGAAGYGAACTMNSWAATAGDHALELPRTAVFHDTDAASLATRLAASHSSARRAALRVRRSAGMPARHWRTGIGGGARGGTK